MRSGIKMSGKSGKGSIDEAEAQQESLSVDVSKVSAMVYENMDEELMADLKTRLSQIADSIPMDCKLKVEVDPNTFDFRVQCVPSTHLEQFTTHMLIQVIHEVEMDLVCRYLKEIPSDVKALAIKFLEGSMFSSGLKSTTLSATNMCSIWESFSKCTHLINGRYRRTDYHGQFVKSLKAVLRNANIDCAVVLNKKNMPKFRIKAMLTHEFKPQPKIYPLYGNCTQLGNIMRNSIAHAQTLMNREEIMVMKAIYPNLEPYVNLFPEQSSRHFLSKKRILFNANSEGVMTDMVLVEHKAISTWFSNRAQRIMSALQVDPLDHYEFKVDNTSL